MLSGEEKREILEDARNKFRRDDFRAVKVFGQDARPQTLDEYLLFLNNIQEMFQPFTVSNRPSVTKFNKL